MKPDPYKILGVERGATPEQVKAAYRKLASQHHPDKGGDTARFQEIQAAYEQINSGKASATKEDFQNFEEWMYRHQYNANSHEFKDIFERSFRRQRPNRDIEVGITLELADSLTEHTKVISVNAGGVRKNITAKIPAGVGPGRTILLRGMGEDRYTEMPAGDLYVHVQYRMPDGCRWNDNRLEQTITVNALDVLLKEPVSFTSALGEQLVLDFPAGFSSGQLIRVRGRGMLDGQERQDLYLKVNVKMPVLDEDGLKVIRELRDRSINS